MQFSSMICAAILAYTASADTVKWDGGYDLADRSMADVSCSDGKYGLLPKYKTQGKLPNFPNIGGAAAISGWGSPNCGSCWRLDYEGHSVKILAIDHAGEGFVIGLTAMNALTNGRAQELGHVDAKVSPLTPKDCGL